MVKLEEFLLFKKIEITYKFGTEEVVIMLGMRLFAMRTNRLFDQYRLHGKQSKN